MQRAIRTQIGLFAAVAAGLLSAAAHAAPIDIWAMSNSGDGNLWTIDIAGGTNTFVGSLQDPVLGDIGGGWSTVAETPDKTLYFLRRFQSDINLFKLDSTNIQVTAGVITNLVSLGSTGLGGNLDGLTAGPDGNIYFTAYDNDHAAFARNGLFRFHPSTGVTDFVGTFAGDAGPSGTNSFYTDLAFDPISGDLIGTGTDSNGAFIPWRLSGASVLTGTGHSYTYVDAFTSWSGFADGLAFNRLSGDLYASSDTGGVAQVDRITGAFIRYVGGTQGSGIGTDLAVQADTIPNVPEPETWALFALGLGVLGAMKRRRLSKQAM